MPPLAVDDMHRQIWPFEVFENGLQLPGSELWRHLVGQQPGQSVASARGRQSPVVGTCDDTWGHAHRPFLAGRTANRAGTSLAARAAAAVKFAQALVEHTGDVTSAELAEVRGAGYGDAEIVEIIMHVGMNILTNIVGRASRVDIDFPKVELKRAA